MEGDFVLSAYAPIAGREDPRVIPRVIPRVYPWMNAIVETFHSFSEGRYASADFAEAGGSIGARPNISGSRPRSGIIDAGAPQDA